MKTSLRLKVGSVAAALCISGAAIGQVNTPSGATVPFGTNTSYAHGILPTNALASEAETAYNSWKSQFVEDCGANGARVKFDNESETVSEGIAYGMLLAAYAADKALFDDLWTFYDAHKNNNGVMNWKTYGCNSNNGGGGAADAELDAAMALLVAEHQWPDNNSPFDYSTEATALITAIRNTELDPNSKQIINGDGWGFGNNCRNPSYMAPAYYRLFAEHVPGQASDWNSAVTAAYTLLNANVNTTTGLVSNWSNPQGQADGCNGPNEYGFDACRNPWRMATDVMWNDDASAAEMCNDLASWTMGKGVGALQGPVAQNGNGGSYHNSTFVSTFAAGVVGAGTQYQSHLNSLYTENRSVQTGDYFGMTLRTLMMFVMTGNFWQPGEGGSSSGPTTILEDFDCSSHLTYNFATGTLTEVANPAPNGVNGSDNSARYVRDASDMWDFILYDMPTAADIGTAASGITMDVYSPQAGIPVIITLRNATMASGDWPAGRHSDYTATTTKSGEWETLSFTFSYAPDETTPSDAIDQMEIKFDGGTASAGTYYYDNIEGLELEGVSSNAITPKVTIDAAPGVAVELGTEITFSVATSENMGSSPSYQWLKNDAPINGATSATYVISNWQDGDLFSLEMTSSATGCLTKDSDISNVMLTTEDIPAFTLFDFDCNSHTQGAWSTFASFSKNADNPDVAAPNTSALVGEYTKGGEDWHDLSMTTTGFEDIADFLSGARRMELDVYSPAIGDSIDITIGNDAAWGDFPAGRRATFRAITTKANEWETLIFVLLFEPDETVADTDIDRVAINFDSNRASSKTFYFDNFRSPVVVGADNSECNIVALAGLFTVEDFDCSNHTTLGWDAGEDAEHGVTNPDPSGINTSDLVGSDTKDGVNDWSNVQINTSGLVDITPLHEGDLQMEMDVYSPVVGAVVAITLVQSDADPEGASWPLGKHSTYSATTTVANEWETLTFSLTFTPDWEGEGVAETLPTDIDRFEINFEEGEISTNKFYWDNLKAVQIEGQDNPPCVVVGIEEEDPATVGVYPNPTSAGAIIALGQLSGVQSISIRNLLGQTIKTIVPTSSTTTIEQLPAGVYNITVFTVEGQMSTKLIQR